MELQIRGVSKTYPNGVHALKDVTLTIPAGMYGLLGPNGAGKSTLMRMIATLQEPDAGTIHLGDPLTGSGQAIDVVNHKDEVRKTLGYPPQEFGVYPKVSAERLLDHFAVLKGITERRARKAVVEALLRKTNLWDVRSRSLREEHVLGTRDGASHGEADISRRLAGDARRVGPQGGGRRSRHRD
jgi:ABC-2 type transport system ATP-binding protein